jgi:fructose-bisphosphate aldolase class I
MYGTKMRSVIKDANPEGYMLSWPYKWKRSQIFAAGMIAIVEPELDINSPTKEIREDLLKAEILAGLDCLGADVKVII